MATITKDPEAVLRRILADELGVDPSRVKDGALLADLGLDSLDEVELTMALEDELHLDPQEWRDLKTVGDVLAATRAAQVTGPPRNRAGGAER